MSNLVQRLLTAVVAVPLLILAIEWKNPIAVWLIVLGATAIGLREWANMTLKEAPAVERWFTIAVGTVLAATLYVDGERPFVLPVTAAFATLLTFLFYLFRYGTIETVAARMGFAMTGYFYVGLLTFLALLKKRDLPGGAGDGAQWIYICLCIAWLSDTGAYFAGRFLGRFFPKKLYESVSPKKTVVGFVGGMAAAYLSVVVAKLWYLQTLTWADTALIAIPANLLGQAGDLCESLVKRSVGVKDSGALLPGHGGMLDRIDALLFVVPYAFAYAHWIYGR